MNKKQELINELRDIEIDTTKKEKKFDFRTALIELFKALYKLFESKKDVSRKDIVNKAERESRRLGLKGYDWSEIFGNVQQNEQVKPQNISSSNQVVNKHPTIGDGNCLFHSVFGSNSSGAYKTDKAQAMRQEWHKFLSQFKSLGDPKIPEALKDQLKTFFQSLLNNPDELNNRPELRRSCQEIMKKVDQVLEDSRKKIEDLKNAIARKFSVDNEFQKQLYEVMKNIIEERNSRSPNNKKGFYGIDTFIRNENKLLEYIGEDVERCASVFDPNIIKERYKKEYIANTDGVMESFFNDRGFYDAYRNSIRQQGYFVFRDEIPILASLANIEIEVFSQNNMRSEIIKPNPEMINEGYERNQQLWGNKERETIYLGGGHYSRAEVVMQDKSTPLLDHEQPQEQTQEQKDYQFAMKLQGQEYKQASQEKSNRSVVAELQAEEISSFRLNAFQEHLTKQPQLQTQEQKDCVLAAKLQQQEENDYQFARQLQKQEYSLMKSTGEVNHLVKGLVKNLPKPSSSMQEAKLTHHQHQYVLTR